MKEVRTFRTVDFNSLEYLMRQSAPSRNVVDILLNLEDPFGISHSVSLEQSARDYSIALYDGTSHVWIGVNSVSRPEILGEPVGFFSLDRRRRRVLYDPVGVMPMRDSYRGFYSNHFGYEGNLKNLLREIEVKGIPFVQTTTLELLLMEAVRNNLVGLHDIGMMNLHIESGYERITGLSPIPRPFRVEGPITVEDIANARLLPTTPLTAPISGEAIV